MTAKLKGTVISIESYIEFEGLDIAAVWCPGWGRWKGAVRKGDVAFGERVEVQVSIGEDWTDGFVLESRIVPNIRSDSGQGEKHEESN